MTLGPRKHNSPSWPTPNCSPEAVSSTINSMFERIIPTEPGLVGQNRGGEGNGKPDIGTRDNGGTRRELSHTISLLNLAIQASRDRLFDSSAQGGGTREYEANRGKVELVNNGVLSKGKSDRRNNVEVSDFVFLTNENNANKKKDLDLNKLEVLGEIESGHHHHLQAANDSEIHDKDDTINVVEWENTKENVLKN